MTDSTLAMDKPAPPGGLGAQVRAGLLWTLVRNWGNRVITLGVFVILARLLAPEELGAFAAAVAVLALVDLFVEQGFGDAIVQRRELGPAQLNAALFVNVGIALVAYAALFLAAPWVAQRTGGPQVATILQVAGLALPLNALAVGQQALARRRFEYRWLAARTLVATALGGIAAVGGALLGFGAWALVAQYLVFATVQTLLLWLRPGWKPGLAADWQALPGLLRYSASVLGTRLLEYGNSRFIEVFLAASLGTAALGIYLVGARVHQTMIYMLGSSVLDVALAGLSRLAHEPPKLREALLRGLELAAALAAPAFVVAAIVAPDLIAVAFGPTWHEAGPLLRALALLGALQVVQFIHGSAWNAVGRPQVTMAVNGLRAAVAVGTLLATRGQPLERTVLAFAIGQAACLPVVFWVSRRVLGLSLRAAARRLAPFAGSAALVAVAGIALHVHGIGAAWPAAVRGTVYGLGAVAAQLALCLAFAPAQSRSVWSALRQRKR